MDASPQRPQGFIETLQHTSEKFFKNLSINSSDVIRVVSFFGIGFLSGLLLKRYIKYLVMFILFTTLMLSVLHYFNFIIVNQDKIKLLLGFQATATCEIVMNGLLTQARAHFLEVGSLVLGCLIGFKLG